MMKKIVLIISVISAFLSPRITDAQQTALADSIFFTMDNHQSMEIISSDYYTFQKWGSLDSLYGLFLSDLSKIEAEVQNGKAANSFSYQIDGPYRKISVNSASSVEHEVSFDSLGNVIYFQVAILHLGKVDQVIFKSPTIQGFRDIGLINLDELIVTSLDEEFPDGVGKNNHASSIFFVEDGKVIREKTLFYGKPMDTIELTWGVGLGTVRSTLTPDLEVKIMVNLAKKGVDHFQMGVSFESLFSFHANEEEYMDVRTNSFLSLVIARSIFFRGTSNHQMWGVKLGGTIIQDDKTFNGTAYKIGFYYEVGRRFTLEPAFIFENSFKTAFPVLRVAVTL